MTPDPSDKAEPSAPDPSKCPLCGALNECGITAGKSKCWCFYATIPPDVLAKIPPGQVGKACICKACAAKRS